MSIEAFFLLLRPFFGGVGFVLFFVGAVTLVPPARLIEPLGLNDFRSAYRSTLGLSLLFGTGIMLAVQLYDKQSIVQRALDKRRRAAMRAEKLGADQQMLQRLTADEKAYLAPFIKKGKAMQRFNMEDGIAGSLNARGIIFCGAKVFDHVTGAEYALSPWAREYLSANPSLLNGASKIDPSSRFRVL